VVIREAKADLRGKESWFVKLSMRRLMMARDLQGYSECL
jgi:hypothetical protein